MAGGFNEDRNRDRWRDDDRERSSWRSGGPGSSDREDDRGFFERAGDEVRSWFSDDDNDRRDQDFGRRVQGSRWDREQNRGSSSQSSRGRDFGHEDRSSFGGMAQGGRPSGSFGREHERGSSRGGGEWRSNQSDRSGGHGASRSDREWHPSDHAQSWGEANRGQSGGWNSDRERDRDQEAFGYGSSMGGTLGGFGNQTFGSSQDDHYRSWRDRQMAQLDRDYDDYCREREQQFHGDFDSWRRSRSSGSPSTSTSPSSNDLGATPNAGVGTTTSSVTGTGGTGSALGSGGSATGEAAKTLGSTPMADATDQTGTADTGVGTGGGRSGSRSRS